MIDFLLQVVIIVLFLGYPLAKWGVLGKVSSFIAGMDW